jgi:Outer membrane protein beta-barrel domain
MKYLHSLARKNKTLLISLVLLFGISKSSIGQIFRAANPTTKSRLLPKAYAGVKLGANFSYLSGSNWDNGIKSNLVGGLFAGIKGPGFGVQIEALFEQSDYTTGNSFYSLYKNYYNDISDSLNKGNFRVNKLCLPVLLQFRAGRLIWIQAGVQFYGIVSVKDYDGLVKDAKQLFRSGSTAGLLGATLRLGNADIGARAIFDVQNLNNLNSGDVWRQYMLQAHIGVRLF